MFVFQTITNSSNYKKKPVQMTEQVCIIEKTQSLAISNLLTNSYLEFLCIFHVNFSVLSSELGNSYIASVKTASHNERNPRALIYILVSTIKSKAVIDTELNLIHQEQFSILFDQCILAVSKSLLGFLCLMDPYVNTGKRPIISGINPKSLISLE
jgi:hypothetical protein